MTIRSKALTTLAAKMLQSDTIRSEVRDIFAKQDNSPAGFMEMLSDLRDRTNRHPSELGKFFLKHCASSHGQLFQDLWSLYQCKEKREGFYVEFGATNGRALSNTCLLEEEYGWTGILAEPNPVWHAALKANRPASIIDTRCVYTHTGAFVDFCAAADAEFGTMVAHLEDGNQLVRASQNVIEVQTVSLSDLLIEHRAPHEIDFMSIDTEGSELEIIRAFDFTRWDVRNIAVEHNFRDDEAKLDAVMAGNGYRRVFKEYSRWDGWYTKAP